MIITMCSSRSESEDLCKFLNFSKCALSTQLNVQFSNLKNVHGLRENRCRGAFGAVHRCVERSTGNAFAAKFINTPHSLDKDAVRKEVGVMSALRHPKLIHLHDAFEDDDEMVMVYEL